MLTQCLMGVLRHQNGRTCDAAAAKSPGDCDSVKSWHDVIEDQASPLGKGFQIKQVFATRERVDPEALHFKRELKRGTHRRVIDDRKNEIIR